MKLVPVIAAVVVLAGCGSSGGSSAEPADWVHPIGAYVAPGCSEEADQRGPQYVIVTSYADGKTTGNTGNFTGVPDCGNVIVYVDADRRDEVRIPKLKIAAKVAPGTTGKLEFYAPSGTYPVLLQQAKVRLVNVVVD